MFIKPVHIANFKRIFINTKIIFKGLENLPKDRRFFVASAHQSICETFVFNAVLDAPVFIVKQELFKIIEDKKQEKTIDKIY